MTLEDVDKMPAGREMDVFVARALGETDFKHPGFFWEEGVTADDQDGWDGFYCPRCGDQEVGQESACAFPYSRRINHTMNAVQKLLDNNDSDLFIEWWRDGEWFVVDKPWPVRDCKEASARCDGRATGNPSLPLALSRWLLKKALVNGCEF